MSAKEQGCPPTPLLVERLISQTGVGLAAVGAPVQRCTTFQRTSVTLLIIAAALDMTTETVDTLWSQAVAA